MKQASLALILLAALSARAEAAVTIVAPQGQVTVVSHERSLAAWDGQTLRAGDAVTSAAGSGFDIRSGNAITHFGSNASFSYPGDTDRGASGGRTNVLSILRSIMIDKLPGTNVPGYVAVATLLVGLTLFLRRKVRQLRRTGGTYAYHSR